MVLYLIKGIFLPLIVEKLRNSTADSGKIQNKRFFSWNSIPVRKNHGCAAFTAPGERNLTFNGDGGATGRSVLP